MKLAITVHPGAKQEKIVKNEDGSFGVWVRARAHDGQANERLIELLAKHFDVAKSRIQILKGHTARKKQIVILARP